MNAARTRPKVIIIGGGATGTGIAREAAHRGFEVILVEKGDLGRGTTGNFHGILHSGARYAVNDPLVAADCYRENQLLRQIVPSAIVDTGGMFVALNDDEVAHGDRIKEACRVAGIPVTQITPEQALQAESQLSPDVKAAFLVPDGFIDGVELMRLNQQAALQAETPATFLTNHTATAFHKEADRITSVSVKNEVTGDVIQISCDYVINAAGVWAGRVAQLAHVPLDMIFDKGSMIVFKGQFSRVVLNRCRPESDGDLLVPQAGQSIMGTTARVITDPDDCLPTQEEVDVLLAEGSELIPAMRTAEATRVYAGVRPLFGNSDVAGSSNTRAVSRSFRVLDHTGDGVENFISVIGGKVTLYRLMAEVAVDAMRTKTHQVHST